MENIINAIYEMLFECILTPNNLVENAKLGNYSYVKYYKARDILIAEMECICADEVKRIFFYEFDSDDSLLKVTSCDENHQQEVLFDRNIELAQLLEEYNQKKQRSFYKQAI